MYFSSWSMLLRKQQTIFAVAKTRLDSCFTVVEKTRIERLCRFCREIHGIDCTCLKHMENIADDIIYWKCHMTHIFECKIEFIICNVKIGNFIAVSENKSYITDGFLFRIYFYSAVYFSTSFAFFRTVGFCRLHYWRFCYRDMFLLHKNVLWSYWRSVFSKTAVLFKVPFV